MPRVTFGGDTMLGRRVSQRLPDHDPSQVWGLLGERMRAADATVVNLECVIAEEGTPADKRFVFHAIPEATEVLEAAGVDAVTLANNHTLDMGEAALVEMLERLDSAGIEHAGAGETVDAAWAPAWFTAGGLDVAMIAFQDNEPSWDVERRQPGLAYSEIDPDGSGYAQLEREVDGLSREADVVVVGAHWGPNNRRVPPETFREFARGLVDAGADVFFGHSAHLFQAVEAREGGVILYDTGDLVDDYRIDPDERNDISFLFEVHLRRDRASHVDLVPTRIDPRECRVDRADPSAASLARERMRDLCEAFDTPLERRGEGLRVPVQR